MGAMLQQKSLQLRFQLQIYGDTGSNPGVVTVFFLFFYMAAVGRLK